MRLAGVWLLALEVALVLNAQQGTGSAFADIQKITLEPQAGFIAGPGNVHSFIVTGYYRDGSARDLTREATYVVSDTAVVAESSKGTFRALAEGVSKVTASVA